MEFTLHFTGVAGLLYLIAYFYQAKWQGLTYESDILIFMAGAGCVIFLAIILLNLAVSQGKGGLVMAVVQTQNFIMLVFEMGIEGRVPSLFEILALTLGVAGSTLIVMARG